MGFDFNSESDRDAARTVKGLIANDGLWKSEKQAGFFYSQMKRWDDRLQIEGSLAEIQLRSFRKVGFDLEPGQWLDAAEGRLYFHSRHTGNPTGIGSQGITWFYVFDGVGLVRKIKCGWGHSGQGLVNPRVEFEREASGPDYWEVYARRDREYQERLEAERLAADDVPTGRVEVRGEVVSEPKWTDGQFPALKCMVKAEHGWRVWVSVPSSEQWEKGDAVHFKATITPSDTDNKFGFAKRPHVLEG